MSNYLDSLLYISVQLFGQSFIYRCPIIWIVIYIALIIWIIKGFFAKDKIKEMYLKISLWFVACMILNGVTVLLPTTFSVIMIIGALITSLVIYNIVDKFNIAKRYRIPFSLLSGWLSVATIVNISKFLRNMGVTNILGINQVGWTNTLLVVGCILAILFTIIRNDIVYPLVFIWGYIGILVQNKDINFKIGSRQVNASNIPPVMDKINALLDVFSSNINPLKYKTAR